MVKPFAAMIAGFAFGFVLVACATADFPYRDYGIMPSRDLMLGPTPKDDLSLTRECEPDPDLVPGGQPMAVIKGKCHVFKSAEYLRLKQDYIELKKRLEACEVRI